MKIYGNASSDRFGFFLVAIGAASLGTGFLLSHVDGLTLLGTVPVFAGIVALMLLAARRFDVMSEVAPATGNDAGVPVRMPNAPVAFEMPFAMKSDTEAVAVTKPVWSATLPVVEKPKSAVETNTAVA